MSSNPQATGKVYRGRDTPEWKYYINPQNSTNNFAVGFSGGGSRACCSAWGVLNSLNTAGYLNYSTFPYMVSNSGGGWTLQPLLYQANTNNLPSNPNSPNLQQTPTSILGEYIPVQLLSRTDLEMVLCPNNAFLSGAGTTKMGLSSNANWWADIQKYFCLPKAVGQDTSTNKSALSITTFASQADDIEKETGLNIDTFGPMFKIAAGTTTMNLPMPIAVGCITFRNYQQTYRSTFYTYPMEFTSSCSGVFRDNNSDPPLDTLGNDQYPDYQVSNVLFNSVEWINRTTYPEVSGLMNPQVTFPNVTNRTLNATTMAPAAMMAVSSNASGTFMQPLIYTMNTMTQPLINSLPNIKNISWTSTNFSYVDGGVVDNLGLMNLIQRRIPRFTVVVSIAQDFPWDQETPDFGDSSLAMGDLTRYFGYPAGILALSKTMTEFLKIAAIFNVLDIQELWDNLRFNYNTYGVAFATVKLPLSPSPACRDFYGISGPLYANYVPVVEWIFVTRPKEVVEAKLYSSPWWWLLNNPTWIGIGYSPFISRIYAYLVNNPNTNFPYYPTITLLNLKDEQANALKYYTAGISDMYYVPHLQKNFSFFSILIDPVRNIIGLANYGLVEQPQNLKISSIFNILPLPLLIVPSPIIDIGYAPDMETENGGEWNGILILYKTYLTFINGQDEQQVIRSPTLAVEFTSVAWTSEGILIGGLYFDGTFPNIRQEAWLHLYYATKVTDVNGVKSVTYADTNRFLIPFVNERNISEITGLSNNTPPRTLPKQRGTERSHTTRVTTCAVSARADTGLTGVDLSFELWLYWENNQRQFEIIRSNTQTESTPTQSYARKMIVMNNEVQVYWTPDAYGVSTEAVKGGIQDGDRNILCQDVGVTRIYDVNYCPFLNSLVIFYQNDAKYLCMQTCTYDPYDVNNTGSSIITQKFFLMFNENPILIEYGAPKIYTGYLGTIFVVQIVVGTLNSIYRFGNAGLPFYDVVSQTYINTIELEKFSEPYDEASFVPTMFW
jgi:hypothetical protein